MAKVNLVEVENLLKKLEDGVAIEEFKDKLVQVVQGYRDLTLAKQKDDQRNATALESLKKSSATELSKLKEEFEQKIKVLNEQHSQELEKAEETLVSEVQKAKEQVVKDMSNSATPSAEVFNVLDEAKVLVKALSEKAPWLSGMTLSFLNKVNSLKK